ncbi:uncharacterized protein LOC142230248 [Haematobia irritans]|uniref:uncharacterized protein LOC142230248 n=1 Tax=Haematobia irritans TaxID=7368 RepID=UPI003F507189
MIATLKHILGRGELQKSIKHLMDIKLLQDYNVYGRQGKKRLLDYPKLMKTIYQAVGTEYGNKMDFNKYFSKCIRLVKNLHYKNESLKKKDATINIIDSDMS